MSLSPRQRVAVTFGFWLATFLVMTAYDLAPRPVLLAGLAGVIASTLCLLLDTSDIAAPATWGEPIKPESSRGGTDVRLRALHRQLLTDSSIDDGGALHQVLVDLTDDRLDAGHGIDRQAEPDRADAVLGPTLAAFVTSPPSARQLRDPRYLSSILTHIEAV